MAQTIKTWLREQSKNFKSKTIEELSSVYCFRDPLRPIKNNPEIIFAPADGIIIDCTNIQTINESIYGKYGNVCVKDLSYNMIPEGSYSIITIFLTFYDVHVVRMPVSGIVSKLELPPIFVENRPMLELENILIDGKYTNIRKELLSSFAYNQRFLYSIKNSFLKEKMYLILTADYDIDSILDFHGKNNSSLKQNQRLATIRYGSMVTCIVPSSWNLQLVCKENTHIAAGMDTLFYYGK